MLFMHSHEHRENEKKEEGILKDENVLKTLCFDRMLLGFNSIHGFRILLRQTFFRSIPQSLSVCRTDLLGRD